MRFRRFHRAQGHQEIVQSHRRKPRRHPDGVPILVELPAFAGAGQDDVVLLRVDEDELDSLQARQVQHAIRQIASVAGSVRQSRFQGSQGNLAELRVQLQLGWDLFRLSTQLGQYFLAFSRRRLPNSPIGVNHDAAHGSLVAPIDLRPSRGGEYKNEQRHGQFGG